MSAKITIDYINDYMHKNHPDFTLISDEYINSETSLLFKHSCGYEFERKWVYLRRKGIYCVECSHKKISPNSGKRLTINQVIEYINSTGCEYISGDYINNKSMLTIKCRCGNIFQKKYIQFRSGEDRCQECGAQSSAQSKVKYTADYVQEKVNKERGYNIDKDKYITSNKYVPCTCSKGHKFNLRFDWYLRGQSGCHQCQVAMQQGENHPNWKGGENEVIDNLRKSIKDWKMEVMAYYGFKCSITGEYEENLAVHHLKAFSTILEESSKKLNIPILRKIKDYEDFDDFKKLKEEVIKNHIVSNGVVLKRDIHNKFHDIYGRGENTSEQFNEFLINNYNTTLEEIQIGNKSELYIAAS